MTAFKVGDRVFRGDMTGTVEGFRGPTGWLLVAWDGGKIRGNYAPDELAIATPVAVAPMLETATGDDLDRIAADVGAGPRLHGESDASFRLSAIQYAAWKQSESGDVVRPVQAADPGVTQAEWSEAIARINAQHKALDTVRRFLGSHSFASCSLACNRELREVMAVVLATLDSDKAFK